MFDLPFPPDLIAAQVAYADAEVALDRARVVVIDRARDLERLRVHHGVIERADVERLRAAARET